MAAGGNLDFQLKTVKLMSEMNSVTPNHIKIMCYTSIYSFVVPEITLPQLFKMASGGHLEFLNMLIFSSIFFNTLVYTIY